MSSIPRQIQIGPFLYAVLSREEPIDPGMAPLEMLLGQCDERQQRIWVTTNTTPTQQAETLLHETLHALHFLAGIEAYEKVRVEDLIDRVSPLLLDTLRRNPELVAFLTEGP